MGRYGEENRMDNSELTELSVEITAPDATDEEIDRMTRQLLAELRQTDIESAELSGGGSAPEGSKGDPITIGSIAIEVLPAVLPAVIGLVQSWASRGQGRMVKFKGKGFEFEGSPEELQRFLTMLEKTKRKKR
jgi:hypothetical protein